MKNNKKDYYVRKAFMDLQLQKTRYQPSLKETLNGIEQQAKQNRQKREEYEKTVKLLKLVGKYQNYVDSNIAPNFGATVAPSRAAASGALESRLIYSTGRAKLKPAVKDRVTVPCCGHILTTLSCTTE